ncbi:unnamed protein product [Vicia faba]|uniref:Uncharacterized protein n=1 Tax=Vicia faba TaxID=3906 RepID=A0AAV0ZPZ2_VICFA|nr:unnamed protein product [Vicia faba]
MMKPLMEFHEGYANSLITKDSRLMQGDVKKMMKHWLNWFSIIESSETGSFCDLLPVIFETDAGRFLHDCRVMYVQLVLWREEIEARRVLKFSMEFLVDWAPTGFKTWLQFDSCCDAWRKYEGTW